MIIAFLIWTGCALLFLGTGIWCRKAEKHVGFFANSKPPEVTDIRAYNHAVSRIWFTASILLEILGLPFLFFIQNSPAFIFTYLGTVFLCLGMITCYTFIESKYRA